MSKKTLQKKQAVAAPKKKAKVSAWDRAEEFLQRRQTLTGIILLVLFLLFGIALFDVKISLGGDDATYIERGYNFIKHGEITFYQGPLYPCVLGVFIGIFGVNITALKLVSFVFMLLQMVFLFLALRRRVPQLILFFLLLFVATNSWLLYYSSQTFTEALFMCLQALALFVTFKLLDSEEENTGLKKNYRIWIAMGFMMLILSLCKSVAIVCFIPILVYFALKRKWIPAALSFASFLSWKIIYEVCMRVFYKAPDIGQFRQILLKDLYQPAHGYETMPGLITRVTENLHTYLSMHLLRMLGIENEDYYAVSAPLAYLVALLLISCTVYLYKKNKYIFFIAVYSLVLYAGIFFGIQASNMQSRLIIILLPLTYLVLISAGYYVSRSYRKPGIAIILFFVVLMFVQLKDTITMSEQNLPLLKRNLKGDMCYGFTPDWVNYLTLSRWCADNLPENSLVACRKGSMSFVYGRGKRFYEINVADVTDADSVLTEMKQAGVTHFILAGLRAHPEANDGHFMNTLNRKFFNVHKKYPEKIKLVNKIGTEEAASLYEIVY